METCKLQILHYKDEICLQEQDKFKRPLSDHEFKEIEALKSENKRLKELHDHQQVVNNSLLNDSYHRTNRVSEYIQQISYLRRLF